MRWCPRCGRPKELHEVERIVATDRYGFDRRINVRHCPLTTTADGKRMTVDTKQIAKAQKEYNKQRTQTNRGGSTLATGKRQTLSETSAISERASYRLEDSQAGGKDG